MKKEQLIGITPNFDSRLIHIRSVVTEKYDDCILIHMPHYTRHGKEHSESIERHLKELLSAQPQLHLNPYEHFLLTSAIWLHDIGMAYARYEEEDPEEIRRTHHERSAKLIIDDLKEIDLNSHERDVVATISLLHSRRANMLQTLQRYPELEIERILCRGTPLTYKNKTYDINVEKLALLLRLLDACDRDHERAQDIDIIRNIAKLPHKAVMHHYMQSLIKSIRFVKNCITLYTSVCTEKEKNMIEQLIVNDIKKELDTLDTLLKKYNCSLTVNQTATISKAAESLPKGVEQYYETYLGTLSVMPENPGFSVLSLEKFVTIHTSGNAIIEALYDILVKEAVESIRHVLAAGESCSPAFRFDNLRDMERKPIQDRFMAQTFHAEVLQHNFEKELIISSVNPRENVYDPFTYKEFDLIFNEKLTEGTRVKYGFGLSATNLFDINNKDKYMTSSIFTSYETDEIILTLKFEKRLNITDTNILVLDEDHREKLSRDLTDTDQKILIIESSQGIIRYQKLLSLYYNVYLLRIDHPERERHFIVRWRFR